MPDAPHPVDADLQHVLDAAAIGVWRWDPRAGRVVWDNATLALFGVAAGGFAGDFEDFVARIHPDDREATVGTIMQTAGTGGVFRVRHRIVRPDGGIRWVEGRGFVQLDDSGDIVGGAGIVYDVTTRQRDAQKREALEETVRQAQDESASSRRRLQALIEADAALAGTLNLERLAARLVDFVTRHGAALAVVDVLREGVVPATMTVSRSQTSGREIAVLGDARSAPRAMHRITGLGAEPMRVEGTRAGWWEFDDPAQAEQAAGVEGEVVSVPLMARGKVVGRLSAVADEHREWSPGRVELLAAVAQRAGTALLQAELYTERGRVAAAFRSNLVPMELPEVAGFDVAVEYRPMHELASLGGDFYDVFPAGDGRSVLAVGDVCGKGVDAAALAAPSRHSLRAAVLAATGPAAALATLNSALLLERSTRFLTAALAFLDPAARRVTVATAGHPPPLVLRAGGDVERPPSRGHLLGVLDGVAFREAEVELGRGDAVVMFTDGLTEARAEGRTFGEERLRVALTPSAGLPAKAITASVASALDTWVVGELADDVVILVGRAVG